MLKHKKFLSILLVLSLFMSFSCAKPNEPYPIVRQTEDVSEHLSINTEAFPKTIKSGDKLPIENMVVNYNNNKKEWLGNSKNFEEDKFFLSTSPDYPTNTIVTNLEVTTNVEKNDLSFYVSYFDHSDSKVYVSRKLTITILNDNAIKPWVWYTITGVVVFAVVGMVMFTRHYKAKKEGKI